MKEKSPIKTYSEYWIKKILLLLSLIIISNPQLISQNANSQKIKFYSKFVERQVKKYKSPLIKNNEKEIYYKQVNWNKYYFEKSANSTPSSEKFFLDQMYLIPKLKKFLGKNYTKEIIEHYCKKSEPKEWVFKSKIITKTDKIKKSKPRVFLFTKPLVTNDKKYILIEKEFYCGSLCMERKVELYEKKGIFNRYKKVATLYSAES